MERKNGYRRRELNVLFQFIFRVTEDYIVKLKYIFFFINHFGIRMIIIYSSFTYLYYYFSFRVNVIHGRAKIFFKDYHFYININFWFSENVILHVF